MILWEFFFLTYKVCFNFLYIMPKNFSFSEKHSEVLPLMFISLCTVPIILVWF